MPDNSFVTLDQLNHAAAQLPNPDPPSGQADYYVSVMPFPQPIGVYEVGVTLVRVTFTRRLFRVDGYWCWAWAWNDVLVKAGTLRRE